MDDKFFHKILIYHLTMFPPLNHRGISVLGNVLYSCRETKRTSHGQEEKLDEEKTIRLILNKGRMFFT